MPFEAINLVCEPRVLPDDLGVHLGPSVRQIPAMISSRLYASRFSRRETDRYHVLSFPVGTCLGWPPSARSRQMPYVSARVDENMISRPSGVQSTLPISRSSNVTRLHWPL